MKIEPRWTRGLWVGALACCLATAGCEKPGKAPPPPPPPPPPVEKAPVVKAPVVKAPVERAPVERVEKVATPVIPVVPKEVVKAAEAALPADLVDLKAELGRALAQLDVTLARLDVLEATTGDLDKPSEAVLEAIETLDTETQSVKKRADDMRERGAAYFEAWEKQLAAMSTPEVMAMAAKRKDELSSKYSEVLTSMQDTRAAFDPLWADVQAIQTAVDDGLTPETLKELSPQIKAAKEKATTLKARANVVASKLDQVSVIYTRP